MPGDGDQVRDPAPATYSMTDDQLNLLLASMHQNQLQLINQFVQNTLPTRNGNFVGCTARFNGEKGSDVEAFIDAVSIYKDCTQVSDENALRGLPMLLFGQASVYWQGVKTSVICWNDALKSLRSAYSVKLPPYRVYRELFKLEQSDKETTELFVCKARALLAQLPATDILSDKIKLDMIYGLLNTRIRERLTRDSVHTFDELLTSARSIEQSLAESQIKSENFENNDGNRKGKRANKCSYCKIFGHDVSECLVLKRKNDKRSNSPSNGNEKKDTKSTTRTISCYGCGTAGVIRSRCTKCNPALTPSASSSVTKDESARAADISEFYVADILVNERRRPVLPISICGLNGTAFADTGATQSIMGCNLYHKLKDQCTFSQQNLNVTLADGKVINRQVLSTTVDVSIQNRIVPTNFVVLSTEVDNRTLLGADFLRNANVVLNMGNNVWCFQDHPHSVYDFLPEIKRPSAIDSYSIELREDEATCLNIEQQNALLNVLTNFSGTFASGGAPTSYAEHCIVIKDGQSPIAVPPYRLAEPKKEILRSELDKLIQDDIIEECESPWAAPVVMVPKKNGEVRVCGDYRRLNEVTVSDKYPMPVLEDLLHAAKKTNYMSTLDLKAGYHQVSVRAADRDKTAFVTPFGMYRYKRMSFGLKNAPATFSRLMDRFKSGLPNVTVLHYLDDLIILSDTFEEHLKDIQATFERLNKFNLRVNRKKSVFVSPSIKYLGHLITPRGIAPNPEKITAISEMPEPHNTRHLKSFIQTCSWFRRFVPGFSAVTKPLTDLLKKNAKWTWGHQQKGAYQKLKELLTTAPILRQADVTKPFSLNTDASDYAIGGVLMQGEGEDERPVEYASRLLTSAERNYSTLEREALAIVHCLNRFRGYIECSEIHVRTDHQPLRWLMSLKSPTGRLARWALQLQAYNLKISYTPGKTNKVADMLSRPICNLNEADPNCGVCTITVELTGQTAVDLRHEQLTDPEVAKIITCFETASSKEELSHWISRGYTMSNGVLYHYSPDIDEDNAQYVVPEQARKGILEEYHDSPTAGHYGVERTMKRITNRYFWPGMRRYIQEYVRRCVSCQKYKTQNLKPAGLVQTPPYNQRFEVLSIDLFGPLPETANGNRWIYIIEDTATKWVELFTLKEATAVACAKILVEDLFLRYGLPRKIISDNGVQFVSDVMQQVMYILDVKQILTPVYHPESNPVERKNRDLKPQLAILVGDSHVNWDQSIASIRFAMNTVKCQSTGHSAAYLNFGRELRTVDDVSHDIKAILSNDNFVPQITPYLKQFVSNMEDVKEKVTMEQERHKFYADQHRRPAPDYEPGSLVLLKTHSLSNASKGFSSKLAPKRDGPYKILKEITPCTYEVAALNNPEGSIGKYHVSELTPFVGGEETLPICEKRRRGRPRNAGSCPRTVARTRGGEL